MYLTAQYIKTVKDHVSTSTKNLWNNDKNYVYEEVVGFCKHLRNSDLKQANVILDLETNEIVKCRAGKNNPVDGTQTFDEIFQYFYSNYSQYFDRMLAQAEMISKNLSTSDLVPTYQQ